MFKPTLNQFLVTATVAYFAWVGTALFDIQEKLGALRGYVEAAQADAETMREIDAIRISIQQIGAELKATNERIDGINGAPPAGVSSGVGGNDLTETIEHLSETPKRVGKEAERAAKKFLDLF